MHKHIEKSVQIHAPKEKVVFVLTDPNTTSIWCSEFMPGSRMEGKWEKGGTVKYLDGENTGLLGVVTDFDVEKSLKVEYTASIDNGVVTSDSEEAKKWVGTYDSWFFSEENGVTTLQLQAQAPAEYYESFLEMWDVSISKIKDLAEQA